MDWEEEGAAGALAQHLRGPAGRMGLCSPMDRAEHEPGLDPLGHWSLCLAEGH